MALDIIQLRKDTPGCEAVLHLNNAGASLLAHPVIDAVKAHIDLETYLGGYEAEELAYEKIARVYHSAATLINAFPQEIAFMDNATRAWEMAFYSFQFNPGDRILTGKNEYASNYLAFLQVAKKTGTSIEVIQDDKFGQLDVHDLQNKLDKRVKLIAITHVPTQGGLINPAAEVGKIARAADIPFLLDATQSVGQLPIDVQQIGCDFLCATGRKYLRGPRGTGFLYMRQSMIEQYEPPMIDLQAATWMDDNHYILKPNAERFETWEQNIAAKIGLGVAIDYALTLGIDAIWDRIHLLATKLRKKLSTIPGITLCDLGQQQCGLVTFISDTINAQNMKSHLRQQHMNVSVSLAEYARLDLAARHLPAVVRASVHCYNTENEIERFCETIESLQKSHRG